MDVLYILGSHSQYKDIEIRLSLRSLEQNGKNIGRIFVVGRIPRWLTNVVFIKEEDRYSRENNAFYKTLVGCKSDISDEFLFMNDDFYMMKPFDAKTYPYYANGELKQINNPSRYQEVQNNTINYLATKGIEKVIDFGVHCPIRYDKKKFLSMKDIFSLRKFKNSGYSPRTLYGNLFVDNYIISKDCKLWANDQITETEQGCISTSDACDDKIEWLEKIFNKKSKYEK